MSFTIGDKVKVIGRKLPHAAAQKAGQTGRIISKIPMPGISGGVHYRVQFPDGNIRVYLQEELEKQK